MTIETANRLYELRKKHNFSQEELAEKLGVSRQAVSKWERSEASPDTDNLIALAKIYGLSLDELIYGEREEENKDNKTAEPTTNDESASYINIDDDDGTKITIGPDGIIVEEKDGNTVKINLGGIIMKKIIKRVEDSIDDEDSDFDIEPKISMGEDGHLCVNLETKKKKTRFWLEVPYPIICAIAYVLCGFYNVLGGWSLSWIIFVTVPVYYTLVEAIYDKKFTKFAYPVLCAFIYLYLGLYQGNWHPSWLIFATVAIYYPIAEALDKMMHRRK